jgi:hypothetical protein
MRKSISLIILSAILVVHAINVSAQNETKEKEVFVPGGKLFGQYFLNVHNTFTDKKNLTSFEIARSFLGYDYSFSRTLSGRIIYDATAVTVSNKMIYQGYLRNVYLQYDNGILNIKGGIITPEQIIMNLYMWNYLYVGRPLIDYSGMTYTSDIGIAAKYNISKQVSFEITVTNGRGCKNLAPDSAFRYSAGLTILPVKNFIIRGYFDILTKYNVSQTTFDLAAAYETEKVVLGGEYMLQNGNLNIRDNNLYGFGIFTRLKLKDKLYFLGRLEDLSSVTVAGSEDPWNLAKDHSKLIVGLEFTPVKGVRLAPNYALIIPDDHNLANTSTIGINVELKF